MENRRMSDEKFNQLQSQLTDHVTFCHSQFSELRTSFGELIEVQKDQTKAITELANATKGVVDVYNSVNGAITVGKQMQRFGLWLLKWPVIGYGLFHLAKSLGQYFDKNPF